MTKFGLKLLVTLISASVIHAYPAFKTSPVDTSPMASVNRRGLNGRARKSQTDELAAHCLVSRMQNPNYIVVFTRVWTTILRIISYFLARMWETVICCCCLFSIWKKGFLRVIGYVLCTQTRIGGKSPSPEWHILKNDLHRT